MRLRQFSVSGAVVLLVLLATVPAEAAPRNHGGTAGREVPLGERVVKLLKKIKGITSNADGLTLPTP